MFSVKNDNFVEGFFKYFIRTLIITSEVPADDFFTLSSIPHLDSSYTELSGTVAISFIILFFN